MQEDSGAVSSRLQVEREGMKRTMLEAVATGAVVTAADVRRYASATLLAATEKDDVRLPPSLPSPPLPSCPVLWVQGQWGHRVWSGEVR